MSARRELPGPLDGLRVLDLGGAVGGVATRTLAELGADVVVVEEPGDHDAGPARVTRAVRHAGKRSVTVADAEDLLRLVAGADLLVHPFTPEELAGRGLAAEVLHARQPGLVVVGVTDFGATGPRRDWRGSGDVLAAVGGVLARSGLPGRAPLLPPEQLVVESAGLQAAWFALLAHRAAVTSGRGDVVDFSALDAVVHTLDPAFGISGSARGGLASSEKHRGRPDVRYLYPIFPCADGWVRICILSPRQWQGMWRWLGEPEEFADPAYGRMRDRFLARDRIYPLIEKLFSSRDRDQVAAEGAEFGVPAAGLRELTEVSGLDHTIARGSLVPTEIGPGEVVDLPAGMLEDEHGRLGPWRGVPGRGEHTAEVAAAWSPRPARPARTAPDRPLEGIRVLDLGVIVAGAETSRLLADHGAEVIRVESSRFPDGSRQSVDGRSMTPSFAWGNRTKRSIGLDLRRPEGRELFLRLVAVSDVVVSNFKPGTMESLGLDHATLREANPRIVSVDSSAYGRSGPWSRRMGYGPLVRASAGLSGLWRYSDDDESFSDAMTVYPDHIAGRVAATAVLAALEQRDRTGHGRQVSVSQFELILRHLGELLVDAQLDPSSVEPDGDDPRGDAPRGVLACAGDDEWCVVDVRGDDDFAALARTIGRDDWTTDPRFADAVGRVAHRHELREALGAWTATRSPLAVAETLQAAGVASGPMLRVPELREDPQLAARELFTTQQQAGIDDPLPAHGREAGSLLVAPPRITSAPYQGEHTRDVVTEVLGTTDDELADLLAAGVLEERGDHH
ncbi:CaiB/BaiF CoA-transferase family protein [Actinomycetospora sp. TBRC 11914]|uniref:CaiB/BaiF CoA transferase family protein n=1 Tax=Actinomycetospora sp. TBRC 11914 TaxID=2729387 RepID=UPI00145D525C|nr:CoA transferase [Actinomycetospora sp. TBRC 11914]NMO91603.1 CoA transferase [Actinomycetospora sp. TBRC 11914]